MQQYTVAVVGALGAVGQKMLEILEQRDFPAKLIKPLDIPVNAGKEIFYKGMPLKVRGTEFGVFEDVDIALFSAGADASMQFAPIAVEEKCVVIDNSSAWRMNKDVPLVIPEINPGALNEHKGIISNPNCSTIQMLLAVKPLHELFKVKRIIVSTYQAASGTGQKAIEELDRQINQYCEGKPVTHSVYPQQLLLNVLPQIDVFLDDGYTKEEMKMVYETQKILDPNINVSATAVRVPVYYGHSEAINIETEHPIDLAKAIKALGQQSGIKLVNDWQNGEYPHALMAEGKDEVFVGRLRIDKTIENGLNLWVVADNLRKGAALNAVQIAEKMIDLGLI